jgi:hypothetical protein
MATFRYGGVTPLDEPQIITGVEWSIECDRENATFEIKTPHGSLRLPVKVRTIFGLIALVTAIRNPWRFWRGDMKMRTDLSKRVDIPRRRFLGHQKASIEFPYAGNEE